MDKQLAIKAALAGIKDLEDTSLQLQEDLKYPVSPGNPKAPKGNVIPLGVYHPDLIPWLVYHLTRRGWRHHPEKALCKPRRVIGSQFPDLVAYVDLDEPDDPIYVNAPEPDQMWSTRPNVTFEESDD